MSAALAAAVVVLALATAVNLLLTFAIIRRMRAGASAAGTPDMFGQVGEPVPAFTMVDLAGRTVTSADFPDTWVFAVLSSDCPACRNIGERLIQEPGPLTTPVLVAVVHDDRDKQEALVFARTLAAAGTVAVLPKNHELLQIGGGISAFPTLFKVRDGVVRQATYRLEELQTDRASAATSRT